MLQQNKHFYAISNNEYSFFVILNIFVECVNKSL